MSTTLPKLFGVALAGLAAVAVVPSAGAAPADSVPAPRLTNIVETARAAGNFTTLLAAVEAAGLTATLEGQGPFTVFAPTDAAFAALPAGTVEGLLADLPRLRSILTYHVVAGEVPASQVVQLNSARTLNGKSVSIVVRNGEVRLNGVKVVQTDIRTSNGIIHVIDAVLLPPAN